MFTTSYHLTTDDVKKIKSEEKIEIFMPELEFETTPLEEIHYDGDNLVMYIDDEHEVRHKITFKNCVTLRLLAYDCAKTVTNYYKKKLKPGFFIMEIKNSNLIKSLKANATNTLELKKLDNVRHFAFPLLSDLIEIVAEDISIEKAPVDGDL